LAWAFVVAALALEVIKAMAFQGCGNHRQKHRLNANGFHTDVISRQELMIETLLL
jgi:hypothetical protein